MPGRVRARYEGRGRRLVGFLLGAGGLLLAATIVLAAFTLNEIQRDTALVEHTLVVQSSISRLAARNERFETGRRGFLIQPDASFARIMSGALREFAAEQRVLSGLVADNPRQVERMKQIAVLAAQREAIAQRTLAAPRASSVEAMRVDFDRERGVVLTRQVRVLADRMARTEAQLLSERNRNQLASLVRFYVLGGLALTLLVGVLLTAILLVLRYNRDLSDAQLRLRDANEGLEHTVVERTAELTRANGEIQRFAYIVSHDLRSPLVNVLGFTAELDQARQAIRAYLDDLFATRPELRDEAVWLAVDEDIPEALDFIRKSTEKMDRLINSILELSRQGRRQLKPEWLDMHEVADTVVASLHQRAEAAGATVAVGALPRIESDRIAVEQILSNLVENALKYLQPGRAGRVSIGGAIRGHRTVEIAVTDNGRGIAPEDHERVFELFRRAGIQDQPGEGIGLANVRALAYRLGGTIELQSVPGEGSTFTLVLPDKFSAGDYIA